MNALLTSLPNLLLVVSVLCFWGGRSADRLTDRQVNHLAPFYLTELLLPNLRKAFKDTGDLSRVVLVASGAHRWANSNAKGAVRYQLSSGYDDL